MPRIGCAMNWGRNKILRMGKNSGRILSRLWTKVRVISGRCIKPLLLSNALVRLSMSCFVQKIFAIKSRSRQRTEQMYKVFGPLISGNMTPTFIWQTVSANYCPPFGKVWVPFADLRLRSLEIKWMQNIWRLGKNSGSIFSRLWTKVHDILRQVYIGDPLWIPSHLPGYVYRISFRRYAVKVAAKLRSRR